MNIEFFKPDLRFYFSFQCPYSYMAWEILKKLLKNSERTLAPIEVGLFPPGNTKFHFREMWGPERWSRLMEDAGKIGLRLNPPKKFVSSLNASRAIIPYGKANAEDYISSVFRGVFIARTDISLPTSLRMHLQSEGIDSSVFAQAIEDSSTEKLAQEQVLFWGTRRLREIPVLEYEDERYSGFMEPSGVERFLRAILD